MTQSYTLHRMQIIDVKQVIAIHLSAFQGFFLTFLGSQFLQELYTAILADPTGIGFVCVYDKELNGFVVGTTQPSVLYGRLLARRWWRFGLACIIPILKNPFIIPRLLRAFRRPQEITPLPDSGTLMSIAVLPGMQGKGIGQSLVQAFLHESCIRGLKHVNLTTDFLNNESVNQFYSNLGFRCVRTIITPEGRKMNEYVIDLPVPRLPSIPSPDNTV